MALKRIVGTVVRHPIATTALVAGVAKGTAEVIGRVARGRSPLAPAPSEPVNAPVVPETVEQVVETAADGHDLPEPVVIYAEDTPEPTPEPEVDHIETEDELVWTSESAPADSQD